MAQILLIDDDEQFRKMLAKMLESDRHQVSQASNGEEGMRLADTARPELIITDILMPKVDGIDIIRALGRGGSGIPIIAMSGGRRSISTQFNLDSAALMGVEATLPKPFLREDLRRAIAAALGA